MIIAIIGSRNFSDYGLLCKTITKIQDGGIEITEIVSGGARGADSLASKFALENKIKLKEFLPDWDTLGKSAGYSRNIDIIDYCQAVIAFWDGKSTGTMNSLHLARRQKKLTKVVLF